MGMEVHLWLLESTTSYIARASTRFFGVSEAGVAEGGKYKQQQTHSNTSSSSSSSTTSSSSSSSSSTSMDNESSSSSQSNNGRTSQHPNQDDTDTTSRVGVSVPEAVLHGVPEVSPFDGLEALEKTITQRINNVFSKSHIHIVSTKPTTTPMMDSAYTDLMSEALGLGKVRSGGVSTPAEQAALQSLLGSSDGASTRTVNANSTLVQATFTRKMIKGLAQQRCDELGLPPPLLGAVYLYTPIMEAVEIVLTKAEQAQKQAEEEEKEKERERERQREREREREREKERDGSMGGSSSEGLTTVNDTGVSADPWVRAQPGLRLRRLSMQLQAEELKLLPKSLDGFELRNTQMNVEEVLVTQFAEDWQVDTFANARRYSPQVVDAVEVGIIYQALLRLFLSLLFHKEHLYFTITTIDIYMYYHSFFSFCLPSLL